MAFHYPKKQTLAIFVICLLTVVIVLYYTNPELGKNAVVKNTVITSKNDILSDNTDWQKQFLGGASSTNKVVYNAKSNTKTGGVLPLTATDIFGRNMFSQFMQIKNAGLENDSEVVNSVVGRMVDSVAGEIKPDRYMISDLNISSRSDIDTVVSYGKTLMNNFARYLPNTDPMEVANKAFNDNNMDYLKNIDPIISNYSSLLGSLRSISVPADNASNHLDMVNAVSALLFDSKIVRETDKDPVKSMAVIDIHTENMKTFSQALSAAEEYFKSKNIVFSTN